MKPIVVVGSLNMDLVVTVDTMPLPGETIFSHQFMTAPGGKGANQSVAAARMGGQVILIGRVGQDSYGEMLVNNMKNEGIDTTFVQVDPTITTGVASITVDRTGQNSIIVTSGANMKVSPEQVEKSLAAIPEFSLLVLQLESPFASVFRAAQLARERHAKVLLNPSPAGSFQRSLLPLVDILVPNEIELQQITGMPVNNGEQAEAAARQVIAWGVNALVVTLGGKGALVIEKDIPAVLFPPYKVKVVDTTAAGDAFLGGLSASLAEGLSLPEAARLGNATGALAVTKMGAQPSLPRREEVEAFLASSKS